MDKDAARWGSAADSLGQAHRAVPALGVAFGGFQSIVGEKYAAADLAVQNVIEVGASRLRSTSRNVSDNNTRTKRNDSDSDSRVRQAANRGGGGGSDAGTDSGRHGGSGHDEGKGKDHYADLMGGRTMPSDPKDPEITFDRQVDAETGQVTWTPREMKPGEATAVDGRDVERIPQRADRILVTMVDGEPRITYVDNDGRPAGKELQPQTEWSRPLPAGADFAVVEVRDGEPHLVFLDVDGNEVTQVADQKLGDREIVRDATGVQA